jgi:hypothetical protein
MLENITENAKAGSKMEDLKIKVSSLHGWDICTCLLFREIGSLLLS